MSEEYYVVPHSDLTKVADAIRLKTGQEEGLTFPEGMVEAIEGIKPSTSVLSGVRKDAKTLVVKGVTQKPTMFFAYWSGVLGNGIVTLVIYNGSSTRAYYHAYDGDTRSIHVTQAKHTWENDELTITVSAQGTSFRSSGMTVLCVY